MKYPTWKYVLFIVVTILGLLYAAPNLYGDDPAVQISPHTGYSIDQSMEQSIKTALDDAKLKPISVTEQEATSTLLIRFSNTDAQLKAQDVITQLLGDNYTVALNLAPATPNWLMSIGATPMKLGLDLRGGVHFLIAVDVDSLIQHRLQGDLRNIREILRNEKIRFTEPAVKGQVIELQFRNLDDLNKAADLISQKQNDLSLDKVTTNNRFLLVASMSPAAKIKAQEYAVEQNMNIIRNRINELGVAEPVVQQQGSDRIAVDLPGVQDTARAKEILGGTATVEMHLVDTKHDAAVAKATGNIPPNTRLYDYNGLPVLLNNDVILSGDSITSAAATIGERGSPAVSVSLGGGGEASFYQTTKANIGNPMAILFVENNVKPEVIDGKTVLVGKKSERVISVATIRAALTDFVIDGLTNMDEGRNLALLLRSGALLAPISIIEESLIGPNLGQENIKKGINSVEIGFGMIVLFMLVYYRLFGLFANIALFINMVLLVAALSLIDATLTLPGIAGIVLTVGMAVDANVLIFERIREELRHGLTPHASIQAGFERAFSTIVDSNVTTLIAAFALFSLGSGAVKGFAITLSIGLIISMFTAITGTRAMIQLAYGRRHVKKLSIGI